MIIVYSGLINCEEKKMEEKKKKKRKNAGLSSDAVLTRTFFLNNKRSLYLYRI